jgi:hypothetical protein
MTSKLTSLMKAAGLVAAGALAVSTAQAASFTLNATNDTIVAGNTTSAFYEVNENGADSGTAASLYTAIISGVESVAANNPPKVEIFFGANPQPVLTSAFVKAGNEYMLWTAEDLALFNSGTYTSIILVQNGLLNNNNSAYLDISHAGLLGTPGTSGPGPGTPGVPDGGATVGLLGMGLAALAFLRRKLT